MIKVIDNGNVYYYDSAKEVREDYPDIEVHGNIVIIK